MTQTALTALQADAWHRPFLTGTEGPPARCEEPRRGWHVALSVNL
jgi:hypothetical protein